MPDSLAATEALVTIGAGVATVTVFIFGLLHDNDAYAFAGLLGYAAVWVYGLARASYT